MKYIKNRPTSVEAAMFAHTFAGKAREMVFLHILREGIRGATDEEIQNALEMNPSTARPRRIELEELRLIADSGKVRINKSGARAIVWITSGKIYDADEVSAFVKKKKAKKDANLRVLERARAYARNPNKITRYRLLSAAKELPP